MIIKSKVTYARRHLTLSFFDPKTMTRIKTLIIRISYQAEQNQPIQTKMERKKQETQNAEMAKAISAGLEPAAFGNLASGAPEANALPLRHDTKLYCNRQV
jgi:uncharacterized protein YprB with RNaseH-like and TPR domain